MGGAVRFGVCVQGLGKNIMAFTKHQHVVGIAKKTVWAFSCSWKLSGGPRS